MNPSSNPRLRTLRRWTLRWTPPKAFGPEQINRLLDVAALEQGVEVGWCNLPNGAGYIANTIVYPGATADMIDWWFAWHPLEDLRYRIWYPPQHAGIMLSPIDRARILDPAIPNREKNWGVVHNVTENCDCGFENIDIAFRSPADMGFDMELFPRVAATFAGGAGWAVAGRSAMLDHRTGPHVSHVLRDSRRAGATAPDSGWAIASQKTAGPELSLPPGVAVPPEAVQGLARHNVREFTRFADLLPRIHRELGHSMFC